MPFVADEVVTAAKLNMATTVSAARGAAADDRTFTNTSYADLDALTGGAGTISAVAVTVTTGTLVTVTVSGTMSTTGGTVVLSYRISGATTLAAATPNGARQTGTGLVSCSFTDVQTITAGVNVFELQAVVVGAFTGRLIAPTLVVHTRIP